MSHNALMLFKRALLAITFMSHIMSSGAGATSTPADDAINAKKIQNAMISPLNMNVLWKGIDSWYSSANGYWDVHANKTISDEQNPNSVAIYLRYSVQRGLSTPELMSHTNKYLVLSGAALRTLASMYDNPQTTDPFLIESPDTDGYRYVFDIYLSWFGYRVIGKYFIMNRYKIAESTGESQFRALDDVLKATFIDACKAKDEYVDNEPENMLEGTKLRSPDGFTEIDLADISIKQQLIDVANQGKSAVVIQTIVEKEGNLGTKYFYKYRFVISWGKYQKLTSVAGQRSFREEPKRAFFVSTSFVYMPDATEAQIGQKPAVTIPAADNRGIKILGETIVNTA